MFTERRPSFKEIENRRWPKIFSLDTKWTSGTVVRKANDMEYGRGPEDDLNKLFIIIFQIVIPNHNGRTLVDIKTICTKGYAIIPIALISRSSNCTATRGIKGCWWNSRATNLFNRAGYSGTNLNKCNSIIWRHIPSPLYHIGDRNILGDKYILIPHCSLYIYPNEYTSHMNRSVGIPNLKKLDNSTWDIWPVVIFCVVMVATEVVGRTVAEGGGTSSTVETHSASVTSQVLPEYPDSQWQTNPSSAGSI